MALIWRFWSISARSVSDFRGEPKLKSRQNRNAARYPYAAICVVNKGNEASLEIGKAYRVIKPLPNDPAQRIRVIDEEREDYLYLAEWFVSVELTGSRKKRVIEAVGG